MGRNEIAPNKRCPCNKGPALTTWRTLDTERLIPIILLFSTALAVVFLPACERQDPVEQEKNRILTPDERYLIELYMKITEIEDNLQDNPEALEEKREQLRKEIDLDRLRQVLLELERDPGRWLAVYNRIHELQNRRSAETTN
jgi:hypothetical protein